MSLSNSLARKKLIQDAIGRCGSEAGSVTLTAALMFPVVIGGIGLGVETGYWYLSQRKLQHVADVSVHAAAVRKKAGDTRAEFTAAAHHVAFQSGYKGQAANMTVYSPPTTGPNAGMGNAVEVIATEPVQRYFTSFFNRSPLTARARAVARMIGSSVCVLALSPTASGAVSFGGSTSVNLPTCDIASNSIASDSVSMNGSVASVNAGCVMSSGGVASNGHLTLNECSAIVTSNPPVPDPYLDVPQPAVSGPCRNGNVNNTTLTPADAHPSGVTAMRFCGGLSFSGKVTLSPGLYIIEKSFGGASGAELTGTGVTLFLAKGTSFKLNGNNKLNLAAPTSGTFSGILFFGDRSDTTASYKISGTSDSTYQGALYFPAASIEYTGNSLSTHGCTQVIARTIEFTGNSSVDAKCDTAGTRDISGRVAVKLVE